MPNRPKKKQKIRMSEETQQPNAAEQPAADINLNDLAVVLQIIDVCSKRGAFEGNELKDVGTLRERIAAFVDSRRPPEPEPEEETEAEAETAEDDAPEVVEG